MIQFVVQELKTTYLCAMSKANCSNCSLFSTPRHSCKTNLCSAEVRISTVSGVNNCLQTSRLLFSLQTLTRRPSIQVMRRAYLNGQNGTFTRRLRSLCAIHSLNDAYLAGIFLACYHLNPYYILMVLPRKLPALSPPHYKLRRLETAQFHL